MTSHYITTFDDTQKIEKCDNKNTNFFIQRFYLSSFINLEQKSHQASDSPFLKCNSVHHSCEQVSPTTQMENILLHWLDYFCCLSFNVLCWRYTTNGLSLSDMAANFFYFQLFFLWVVQFSVSENMYIFVYSHVDLISIVETKISKSNENLPEYESNLVFFWL